MVKIRFLHRAIISISFCLSSCSGSLVLAAEPTSTYDDPLARRVTLVLGGGALKAVGEIGVLQILQQEKIPIDFIYGSSCGSVIGALYASGMPADDIAQLFLKGKWQRSAGNHFFVKSLFIPVTKIIPLSARNKWPGVLDGRHYQNFLCKQLPATFDELRVPFRAVAVNLCDGTPVVLKSGNLSNALLASSAMPPAIRPVESGDALLADGGLRRNLPTECARKAGEGQFVIAVSSDGPLRTREKRYFNSLQRINRRAADLLSYQSDESARNTADILITPDIDALPVMTKNRKKIQAAIDAGREAALKELPNIRRMLNGSKATSSK